MAKPNHPQERLAQMAAMQDFRDILLLLHSLALEYKVQPWWKFWRKRWVMDDEPLREDAARILRGLNYKRPIHADYQYVGDPHVE